MPAQAYENPRLLPQQGVLMYSNIADIERYVNSQETAKWPKGRVFTIYQLDPYDRMEALSDLQMMGITPSSLFPGLEGICKQLSWEHFRV